jgi:two-component system sensor histidine kinase DctS
MTDPSSSARATASDRPGDPHTWHWYAARAGIGLSVAALLGFVWILHLQELDEHHAGVVRDMLWLEQNLQSTLERDLEQLRLLAPFDGDMPLDERRREARVKQIEASSPGLVQVVVLDERGVLQASAPAPATGTEGSWVAASSEAAYRLARSTGKPTYAPPRLQDGEYEFEVFVPWYRDGAHAGTVVGVYGLKSLLASVVPWWLAQKHRVTVRDADGDVLAAKSSVEAPGHPELTHEAALDPPGHGLVLHVESYGSETQLVRNVLVLTILGLAAAVLGTMWSLRRHVQRRVDIERALREEHAFRKAMEDSLETGMRAVDLEGRIVYVNPAFCRMVGYSEAELTGLPSPHPYWPPAERGRLEATVRAKRAAGESRVGVELELVRRNGECFDALLYETPLVDTHGRQTGWMGSVLDVTEQKRDRERVRHQEEKLAATARLVTMGEMASSIAHELNQPLSAIASYTTGCLNIVRRNPAAATDLEGALERTTQQVQRAGQIIRRVHDFVRKSEPTRSRVRVNALVADALGFAQAEARKRGARIVFHASPDDPELLADPVLLQQVLINLLRNGMEAMAATPEGEREILVTTDRAGSTVTVRVADRGCGLSPEVRDQLFEPFFTTKPQGMGMGLNICRSIIQMHRGRVWALPGVEGGTVFSFSLPLEVP